MTMSYISYYIVLFSLRRFGEDDVLHSSEPRPAPIELCWDFVADRTWTKFTLITRWHRSLTCISNDVAVFDKHINTGSPTFISFVFWCNNVYRVTVWRKPLIDINTASHNHFR